MCSFSDKDFRNVGSRNMSEFMWTIVKDPLDAHLSFDNDGLDLAFKYFTSTTLTMRLAGIAQINASFLIRNVSLEFRRKSIGVYLKAFSVSESY